MNEYILDKLKEGWEIRMSYDEDLDCFNIALYKGDEFILYAVDHITMRYEDLDGVIAKCIGKVTSNINN